MLNPMQLVQMMKGGNPQQIIQQMIGNNQMMSNPIFKNAMDMYQNQNMAGLQNMAENLCKERGTTIDDMRKQLGI